MLGRRTRRNIRQTARSAEALGLEFSFAERGRALEVDDEIAALAQRNRPFRWRPAALRSSSRCCRTAQQLRVARDRCGRTAAQPLPRLHPGKTAYLVYQMNDPAIPGISLAAFHDFRLIEQLIACGASELIFVMGSHQFKRACQVSSKDELITIRPSPRGLAVAVIACGGAAPHALRRGGQEHIDHDRPALVRPAQGGLRPRRAGLRSWPELGAGDHGLRRHSHCAQRRRRRNPDAGGLGLLSYVTAYPAFMSRPISAGAWTGLLTITIGGAGILYWVIPPYDSFGLERTVDVWSTAIYMVSALALWLWSARRSKLAEPA